MPRALALLLLLSACDPITVEPAPPPEEPGVAPGAIEDPGDAPCETLSRGLCLRSVVCTLVAPSGRASASYLCRPAHGNCEVGLIQTHDGEDRCVQRTGCMWQPARCYCPCRGAGRSAVDDGDEASRCECQCSGGPPASCVPR